MMQMVFASLLLFRSVDEEFVRRNSAQLRNNVRVVFEREVNQDLVGYCGARLEIIGNDRRQNGKSKMMPVQSQRDIGRTHVAQDVFRKGIAAHLRYIENESILVPDTNAGDLVTPGNPGAH